MKLRLCALVDKMKKQNKIKIKWWIVVVDDPIFMFRVLREMMYFWGEVVILFVVEDEGE